MLPKKGENFFFFGGGLKHLFPLCLHDEKNGFIVLDTLSGNVRDLLPQKMSKNNTPYFAKNYQVELDDLKRVACFNKQRYELFRKFNNSDTEVVVIKKIFIYINILITHYININTSSIIRSSVQQNITTISEVLAETIMYYRVKIEAVISDNIRQHDLDEKMVTVCTGVAQNDAGLVNESI